MTTVVDSYGPHTPAELDAVGAIGTMRYIGPGSSNKHITKGESDMLLRAGKMYGLVAEGAEQDYVQGYSLGQTYADMSRRAARDLLFPDTRPLYIAVDTDLSGAQIALAVTHVAGFHSVAGPTGVYGTAALIDACFAAGVAQYGWQSCSTGFHDNRRTSSHAALLQHCGDPTFDFNTVLKPDWGQLPSVPVVPVPSPPAPPAVVDLQGDNVKLTSIVIDTDENGDGWHPTSVPWNTFLAATPQGSYPSVDGYWPLPKVGVQQRNGTVFIELLGGKPHGSHTIFVASTH